MKRLRLIGSILYYLGFIVLMCQLLLWIDPSIMDTAQGRMGASVLIMFCSIPFLFVSEACEFRKTLLDIILGEE